MLTVANRVGHHLEFSEDFFDLEDILLQLLRCFFPKPSEVLLRLAEYRQQTQRVLDWYNLGPQ